MEERKVSPPDFPIWLRWVVGVIALSGLIAVFLFQRIDWSAWFLDERTPTQTFMINRGIRYICNDIFATLLVLALFGSRKFVIITLYAQLAGLILILLPYLVLKAYYPGYNGPLLSFFHRLVLNPTLIYLLIFFFWQQKTSGLIQGYKDDTGENF